MNREPLELDLGDEFMQVVRVSGVGCGGVG